MCNSNMCRSRVPAVLIALGTAIAVSGTALAGEANDPSTNLKLSYSIYSTSTITPTTDPACPLKVVIAGAGLTDLLGPIHDEQSHCVQLDGSIDQGVAKFTAGSVGGSPGGSDSADSITAQYRAHVVPTPQSVLPTATTPAAGFWLIYGELCVWKGTGRFANVINDCPVSGSAGHFVPARGTLDFDTGQASVFGTEAIRLSEAIAN